MTATAIAGLGMSEIGKVYGRSATQLGAEAVIAAVADAGMELAQLDGLIVSSGTNPNVTLISMQGALGLTDLSLLTFMQGYGSTAAQMVQYATMAVQSGMATTIACVWTDDPLSPSRGGGAAYQESSSVPAGWQGINASNSLYSANTFYALAARRHMETYGTTSDQLGRIAVAQRDWAVMNPLARFRTPLSLENYHDSRYIAEPFHLYDCCMVSNGAVAVIVTTLDHAKDLAQPPLEVLGWGQSHPGKTFSRNDDFGLVSGAVQSGPKAFAMAGLTLDDIDVVELYDCYTYTTLITLEDYGFCAKGEGGAFVEEPGMLGPSGKLKLNTGGGELSSYYLWGMTPLSEAIIQGRGQAGERQVHDHDRVLVSGNGGILDYHATLILGTV